jgi:hypothetical protein
MIETNRQTAPGRDPDAVRLWYRRNADCEPASAVRGPKYVTKKGKTPALTPDEAPLLLNSISVSDNSDLRDRGHGLQFRARLGRVVEMNIEDYW